MQLGRDGSEVSLDARIAGPSNESMDEFDTA